MQELIEAARVLCKVLAERQGDPRCVMESRPDGAPCTSDNCSRMQAAEAVLALGAVPEGGEERGASADEIGGSPPAAAKSDGQSSAGWRDLASVPRDGRKIIGLHKHGYTVNVYTNPEWADTAHHHYEGWMQMPRKGAFALRGWHLNRDELVIALTDWPDDADKERLQQAVRAFVAALHSSEEQPISPSANGASAGNSGLDEPLPPALPYSAASRP